MSTTGDPDPASMIPASPRAESEKDTKAELGGITRREFARAGAAVGVAGALAPAWLPGVAAAPAAIGAAAAGPPSSLTRFAAPMEIAEFGQFFLGADGVHVARGTLVNGAQMSVEYQIPVHVRHPFPIVLVHGGAGQGSDWLSTPDGRMGWASLLLQEGYRVYVVDRPGQGRAPYDPQFHGGFANAPTYEEMARSGTGDRTRGNPADPLAALHSQWPGSGLIGDPSLDQLMAAQGQAFGPSAVAESLWRSRGALLLDQIGPAVLLTHGDSGAFAWVLADERPQLVRGIIALEPAGPAFSRELPWGVTAGPISYAPAARQPSELAIVSGRGTAAAPGYALQAQPARRLVHLSRVPIAVVTAEASAANLRDPGTVEFLRQAGCSADHVLLADHGVHGNGHFMMMEKNHREVLAVLLDWLSVHVRA